MEGAAQSILEQPLEYAEGWRNASLKLTPEMLAPNAILRKDWLEEAFSLPKLEEANGLPPAKVAGWLKQRELSYLRNMTCLREYLLEERKVLLRAVPSLGYEVVPPEEQAEYALEHRFSQAQKAVKCMVNEIRNTDLAKLTDEQRASHANSSAKAATLAGMIRQVAKPIFMPEATSEDMHARLLRKTQ
jgi:hypothetical protein